MPAFKNGPSFSEYFSKPHGRSVVNVILLFSVLACLVGGGSIAYSALVLRRLSPEVEQVASIALGLAGVFATIVVPVLPQDRIYRLGTAALLFVAVAGLFIGLAFSGNSCLDCDSCCCCPIPPIPVPLALPGKLQSKDINDRPLQIEHISKVRCAVPENELLNPPTRINPPDSAGQYEIVGIQPRSPGERDLIEVWALAKMSDHQPPRSVFVRADRPKAAFIFRDGKDGAPPDNFACWFWVNARFFKVNTEPALVKDCQSALYGCPKP